MLIVIAVMLVGVAAGYALRGKNRLLQINARMTMWIIYLLLFFLGLSIGSDDYIFMQLPDLGFMALLVTLFALLGSLVAARILWHFFFSGKEEQI